MARSIATIQSTMDAEQATQTNLTTLNSTSQTAIYTLWKFITSTIINYVEQLWDIYKSDLESIVASAPVGSSRWLQKKVLYFQYDSVTPQVLEIDSNFAISYPVIDATKRLITRCAIITTPVKQVIIKVAKSEPPVALTTTEKNSLIGYVSDLSFAGINYSVVSLASDKIYIKGNIYYNGQYALTISDAVIASINTYLANIPFNGTVSILGLTDAIQSVTGVTDLLLVDVAMRADATAFSAKTYLINNKTNIITSYQSQAGYITEETTSGSTFVDQLTFIAQ